MTDKECQLIERSITIVEKPIIIAVAFYGLIQLLRAMKEYEFKPKKISYGNASIEFCK